MDASDLPTDMDQLKALFIATMAAKEEQIAQAKQQAATSQQQAAISEQLAVELSSTVAEQQAKLASKEQTILELLRALRGKQRERIDPDQLVLFEIGELESLIQEQKEEEVESRRKPKRRRRRLIPDNLPTETIEHTLGITS